MSVETAVAAGRAAAERRMTSRCTIRRLTGKTTDEDDWEVDAWTVIHADLQCRLTGSERTRTVRVGDSEVQVAVRELHVPACTDGLRDGDLADLTDGENAGSVYRLVEVSGADQQTARRVPVVETQRPEEWS